MGIKVTGLKELQKNMKDLQRRVRALDGKKIRINALSEAEAQREIERIVKKELGL